MPNNTNLSRIPATNALRLGIYGACATLIGILLSGPVGVSLVALLAPQPAWEGSAQWAAHFDRLQTFPFFGGFLLIGGYLITMAALYQIASVKDKTRTLVAVMFTTAFATLIFFNYINQTTFLPALASPYLPENAPLINAFSLSNPRALCWAIEMWGYALLGVATWIAAPVFHGSRLEKTTAWLMIANGVVSLLGGVIATWNLAWVFTTTGLVNYALWNVLVFALAVTTILSLKRRLNQA